MSWAHRWNALELGTSYCYHCPLVPYFHPYQINSDRPNCRIVAITRTSSHIEAKVSSTVRSDVQGPRRVLAMKLWMSVLCFLQLFVST